MLGCWVGYVEWSDPPYAVEVKGQNPAGKADQDPFIKPPLQQRRTERIAAT